MRRVFRRSFGVVRCAQGAQRGNWKNMFEKESRLTLLLRAAATRRQDVRLASLDDHAIRWAVATGLGPLLHHVTRDDDRRETSPLWPRVHSAHLTARLVAAGQQDATTELLDACAARGCTLTLLKGIRVAHELYPEPGLRPMRDIDVLVPDADVSAVEAALTALGYRQRSDAPDRFYERHHHTMPFFEPRRNAWVEVHHRLASPRRGRAVEEVLSPEHVAANLEPADFMGRPVTRLTSELHLVHLATHWASRFQVVGGAIPLLDAVYLLKRPLAWNRVLDWLARAPLAAAHLHALLTYLARRSLASVAPAHLDGLAARQQSFGDASLRLVHRMIDRYLLDGVPPGRVLSEDRLRIAWSALFEPGSQARKLASLPWRMRPRPPDEDDATA
jgi:hypothetical protein